MRQVTIKGKTFEVEAISFSATRGITGRGYPSDRCLPFRIEIVRDVQDTACAALFETLRESDGTTQIVDLDLAYTNNKGKKLFEFAVKVGFTESYALQVDGAPGTARTLERITLIAGDLEMKSAGGTETLTLPDFVRKLEATN